MSEELFPAGLKEQGLRVLNGERERIFDLLVSRHHVSMWDMFDESGIGQERNAIANNFVESGSSVLDVAAGRGYFAFAAARRARQVVAVDLMDLERIGWWRVFLESSQRLGLNQIVSGLKSDAISLPLVSEKFNVASCIHSIRNFLLPSGLNGVIIEMSRILSTNGRILIAESSNVAERPDEEVYLAYLQLRSKIGWETTLPDNTELESLLTSAGFSMVKSTKMQFTRDYAPVEFPSFFISEQPPKIRKEHERIEKLRKEHGMKPTAVVVVTGTKVQRL